MPAPGPDSTGTHRQSSRALAGWILPAGFGCVAIGLLAAPRRPDIPAAPPARVDPESLVVRPMRVAMADPPHVLVEGRPQRCNGCHQIFRSSHRAGESPAYHREIRLAHGLNDRCVNCHDPVDRERLTLRSGDTVPFAEAPRLCAQCHGTLYRDWEQGTHGKTLGSWVTGADTQRRLACNECHDPHSPRYEPIAPLPGPNTLRMGDPSAVHTPSGRSPLRRFRDGAHP